MDLRQLENIVAIEQEQSISKAAERLFMSQSALNQQLLKLENELGVTLFDRSKRQMIPTFAGRVYLNAAHEILNTKEEAYKIIHDIAHEHAGEIKLAYSPEQGSLMFSNIYYEFHAHYPDVTFKIQEARGLKMASLILQREVTIAVLAYTEAIKQPLIEYHDFGLEYQLLAVHKDHPFAAYANPQGHPWTYLDAIDIDLLQSAMFVLSNKETLMRTMVDRTFQYLNITPNVLFETGNNRTLLNMVRNGQCMSFLPQSYSYQAPDVAFFSIPPHETWHRAVAYLKGTYLSEPERYLIQLIQTYYNRESV